MTAAIAIPYTISFIVVARILVGHFAYACAKRYRNYDDPDGYEWFIGALHGISLALIWPVLVAIVVTIKASMLAAKLVGIQKLSIGAEREAVERKKSQRIKELERELELNT